MKKLICIVFVISVLFSFVCSSVYSVTYTDITPTYTKVSEISHYNGYDSDYDGYIDTYNDLMFRSNCYGYALRMHYGPVDFPTSQYLSSQLYCYKQ